MILSKGLTVTIDGRSYELDNDVHATWQPKIGDQVSFVERKNLYAARTGGSVTLLYIHQYPNDERKWAVVAYYGDIPKSVYFEDLRPV